MNPESSGARPSSIAWLDQKFMNPQGLPARIANGICSHRGEAYLNSRQKRVLDLALAIPGAIAVTPLILVLAGLQKLEDGGPMFFVQERIGSSPGKPFKLVKIRCMKTGSDMGGENIKIARGGRAEDDPRCTRLGRFMRKYELEELPQLFQVIKGELSLIGNRPLPEYVITYLKKALPSGSFFRWEKAKGKGRPGVSGFMQLFGSELYEDETRVPYDVYYAINASLGMDLYLIWRTMVQLTGLLSPDPNGKIKK